MKILLLPGLGDVHWTILKLKDWLQLRGHKNAVPELWIWDFDNRPRTIDYFDRVPFVKRGDYFKEPLGSDKKIFDSLYMLPGRNYIENFRGFDYLIGLNGDMRNGVSFKNLMDGAECDYSYGPVWKAEDIEYDSNAKKLYGKYLVLGFSDLGMFKNHWAGRIRASKIKRMLDAIRGDYKLIFTGCKWDAPFTNALVNKKRDINLVDQTKLGQFLGLIQMSQGYIGWCGGNSIIAQHLRIPTVEWWSRSYFPKHDRHGWKNPLGKYLVLETEDFEVQDVANKITRLLTGE